MTWEHGADPGAGGAGLRWQDRDRAAVQLADPARDREPEAGAAARVAPGPEAVEDPGRPVCRNPRSLVGDLEHPSLGVEDPGPDGDGATDRAVPDGVVQEVGKHLGEAVGVRLDEEAVLTTRTGLAAAPTILTDHGDEADPPLVGATGRGFRDSLRDEPPHVDGRERQRLDAAVDPAEVEEVGHEVAEALGLGERGAERGVVGRHDAVDEVLEQRLLGGQGRAQLVGHRGDELTTLLVRRGEVGRHGVEGPRQLAHLVGRRGRDPARVVTRRHRARLLRSSPAPVTSSRAPATGRRRGRRRW